jgi:hypothetical protein
MNQICLLCGKPLPPDTRWRITKWLNPRPPTHPPSRECYDGFRARLGLPPGDEQDWQHVKSMMRERH